MPVKVYRMSEPRWPAAAPGYVHFAYMDVHAPQDGVASLTVLDGLEKPLTAKTPDGPLVIVADGFHWVQFAPRGERWWLTAMFDTEKQLLQFYFDVTFENYILPSGESWCRDAYIDVVLDPNGRARILDKDELDGAFAAGEITRSMYDQALAGAASVAARFQNRTSALEQRCRAYLNALLPRPLP